LNRFMIQWALMSDERLKQFVAAWELEFAEELFPSEAKVTFDRLLDLYRLILRPLPRRDDGEVRDVGDVAMPATPPSDPAPSPS
jgi:hypothetical protein